MKSSRENTPIQKSVGDDGGYCSLGGDCGGCCSQVTWPFRFLNTWFVCSIARNDLCVFECIVNERSISRRFDCKKLCKHRSRDTCTLYPRDIHPFARLSEKIYVYFSSHNTLFPCSYIYVLFFAIDISLNIFFWLCKWCY